MSVSHFPSTITIRRAGGSHAGPQQYQNAYSPGSNYGNSNFDVRNAFKGNIVYELPFGHDQRFLNKNWGSR